MSRPWVGQAEHLCGPDLARGCPLLTFDLELERLVGGYLGPLTPWVAHQHGFVTAGPPMRLQHFLLGTASGSSLAFGPSCALAFVGV